MSFAARVVLAFVLAMLSFALFAPAARAQSEPEVTVRASARQVEVGEPFSIELKALAEGSGSSALQSPDLRAPREFSVQGPQTSTQTVAQFGTGGATVKTGIGATWELVGSKPGHYVIPSPTIAWNSKRLSGKSIPVDVVPSTGRPHNPPSLGNPFGSNPFLLPGGPRAPFPFGAGRSPFDDLDDATDTGNTSSELSLPAAPDSQIFLHAAPDKTSAVVGEQITLSFYVYTRVDAEVVENHDAKMADFLRVPLLKNPGTDKGQIASAGGMRFAVRLIDKVALFPLKAGDLHTGSMTMRFSGRRLGSNVLRESNDVVFHVTEPPQNGRPPGYTLGDVGSFSMTGTVEPRQVEQGGTVSVTVKVSGAGNLPQTLHVPERAGVEWLDPEKRESIDPQAGIVQGWRSFGYVVRLKQAGHVDLGAIELPFWDPAKKKYDVARVELGSIEVTPSTTAPAPSASAGDSDHERDPFPVLPAVRKAPGAYAPPKPPPIDARLFWILLAVPPLGVVFSGALARGIGRARQWRSATRASPSALASNALRDVDHAEARRDPKALAGAAERAVYFAIEAATGLKGRGVLLDDLPAELGARGVGEDVAKRAKDVLAGCAAIRFQPEASADFADVAGGARTLCRELARAPRRAEDRRSSAPDEAPR